MDTVEALLVLVAASTFALTARAECMRVNACSCRDQETSELVSLYPLANRQGYAGLNVTDGNQVYEYNPCLNITSFVCKDVAFCQHSSNAEPGDFTSLGLQDSVQFIGSPGSSEFKLQLQSQGQEWQRKTTYVNLICDRKATTPNFTFTGQHPSRTFNFNLTTECACPGACQPPPEQCMPDPINKCSCHLSGDDDLVNIASLDDPSSPLLATLTDDNRTGHVYFNPCSGMTGGPTACHGSTACLQFNGAEAEVVGLPSTARFQVDVDGNTLLVYSSEKTTSVTIVKLVCDYAERHLPKLKVIAYNGIDLRLEMRSICACAGACIEPPLTCTLVDDCSCKIIQGSQSLGMVSLHELNNPQSPLTYHFVSSGQGNTFLYNPCGNFSVVGRNHQCLNVSGCQFGGAVSEDNPDTALGYQSTAQFRASQEGVVTISYSGGTQGRHFSVQLLCNSEAEAALLTILDTNIGNNVHMQLETKYACAVKTP